MPIHPLKNVLKYYCFISLYFDILYDIDKTASKLMILYKETK